MQTNSVFGQTHVHIGCGEERVCALWAVHDGIHEVEIRNGIIFHEGQFLIHH